MACPEHVDVPWLTQPEWESGVALAHRIFGGLAMLLIIIWCTLLLELCRPPLAFALAGCATIACGLWLTLWVVWLLKKKEGSQ